MYCRKCGETVKGNESNCPCCGVKLIHNEYMLGFWDISDGRKLPIVNENKCETETVQNESAPTKSDLTPLKRQSTQLIRVIFVVLLLLIMLVLIIETITIVRQNQEIKELKERISEGVVDETDNDPKITNPDADENSKEEQQTDQANTDNGETDIKSSYEDESGQLAEDSASADVNENTQNESVPSDENQKEQEAASGNDVETVTDDQR